MNSDVNKQWSSGACVATMLSKDEVLHKKNVSDNRVILSRNSAANPITNDHCHSRQEDDFGLRIL